MKLSEELVSINEMSSPECAGEWKLLDLKLEGLSEERLVQGARKVS